VLRSVVGLGIKVCYRVVREADRLIIHVAIEYIVSLVNEGRKVKKDGFHEMPLVTHSGRVT
jgi:hypothetical protein